MSTEPIRLLLAWSDHTDPHPQLFIVRPWGDRSPVLRLLGLRESEGRYHAAILLAPNGEQERAAKLAEAMRTSIAKVDVVPVPVDDPSDPGQLFDAIGPVLDTLPQNAEIDVLLSSGTPETQGVWMALVQAELLSARMLQVFPASMVPDPHPEAFREVQIKFWGFPHLVALRKELAHVRRQARLRPAVIGDSPPMDELRQGMTRASSHSRPVLVVAEHGSEAEFVARAIHQESSRADCAYVTANCTELAQSKLPDALMELVESADLGTLYLAEVDVLPLETQDVLVQFLLTKELPDRDAACDVRVVVATHQKLDVLVENRAFDADLYDLVMGTTLQVPPLRDRVGDLPAIVAFLLEEAECTSLSLDAEIWPVLEQYWWPGNWEELRAEVRRWATVCTERVGVEDLAESIRNPEPIAVPEPEIPALRDVPRAEQHEVIHAALQRTNFSISKAAKLLQIDKRALMRKMARFRIGQKFSQGYSPIRR